MVVGLFGGSFNPPHSGHALVAEMAIKRLGLDRLWWMVTPANPLKEHRGLASVEDRVALSRALVNSPKIVITAFETTIASFFTAKTIDYIKAHNRGVHFVLVMGADSLANFHYWHHWRAIVANVPIAVIDRPSARMAGLSSHFAQTLAYARILPGAIFTGGDQINHPPFSGVKRLARQQSPNNRIFNPADNDRAFS